MKKIILILIVLYLPLYFQGCDCGEYHTLIVDFDINVLDNSGPNPIVSQSNQISKKALGFAISTVDSVIVYNNNIDLGVSCYGWTCEQRQIVENKNAVVRVITINQYSNKYNAGDDVTDLFLRNSIHYTRNLGKESYQPNYKEIDEIGVLSNLFLNDTTALPSPQKFLIKITYSNNVTIQHETPTLNLF